MQTVCGKSYRPDHCRSIVTQNVLYSIFTQILTSEQISVAPVEFLINPVSCQATQSNMSVTRVATGHRTLWRNKLRQLCESFILNDTERLTIQMVYWPSRVHASTLHQSRLNNTFCIYSICWSWWSHSRIANANLLDLVEDISTSDSRCIAACCDRKQAIIIMGCIVKFLAVTPYFQIMRIANYLSFINIVNFEIFPYFVSLIAIFLKAILFCKRK